MTNPRFALGVVVLVLAGSAPVWGRETAAVEPDQGFVGSAFILRQNATIPAELGQAVFETRRAPNGGRRPDWRHVEGRYAGFAGTKQ